MHELNDFLLNLTLVLGVAALTSFIFHKLKQPVVLGYVLAGIILSPYTALPLFADGHTIHTLSELGVILLMFSLGLEFSFRKLLKVFPSAGLIALVQCSLLMWLGYVAGQAFGWTNIESLYAGALIAISSTTIIVKAFHELGVKGKITEIVYAVLIVEDLIAILLLAGLPIITQEPGTSSWIILKEAGSLFMFLVTLVTLGIFFIPRIMRSIMSTNSSEMTLVVSIGLCFVISLLSKELGYSVALGAFLTGSLMAESGEEAYLHRLIEPVRDIFAAVFFVSVGMLINPSAIGEHWSAILIFTLLVIFGKILGVTIGAFLTGYGIRLSIKSAMSLTQIGEFSFIIAGIGVTSGMTGDFLYPLAVAVSAITTLTTPWFIRSADSFSSWFEKILPHRLQVFTTFYESWIQRLKSPATNLQKSRIKKLFFLLIIDITLLTSIVVGAILSMDNLVLEIMKRVNIAISWVYLFALIATILLALPFVIGIIRCIQALGHDLATRILPKREDTTLDLANAPRRALIVTLQMALTVLIGMPLVAITQPFIPKYYGAIAFVSIISILGIFFWKRTTNFYGHVTAGAEMVLEMMNTSIDKQRTIPVLQLEKFLPGLGPVFSIRLNEKNNCVGLTLSELNLRSLTGANIIAITRDKEGVVMPTGNEILLKNDLLSITGSEEAIKLAKKLLTESKI